MLKVFMVGMGGFLGSIARYALSGLVQRAAASSFPVGTFCVNIAGCLFIGGLMSLVEDRHFFTPEARLFLLIGFLGSFTTLSTVGYETFEFLRGGEIRVALLNASANLVIGVIAVAVGWVSAKLIGV